MIKKRFSIILLVLLMVFSQMFIFPAAADSASISMPSTAYIGDTITVKVTFECTTGSNKIGSIDAYLEFDSTILECTSNPTGTNLEGASKYLISYFNAASTSSKHSMTFKFKCKKAGTAGIYVEADITDTDETKTTKKTYNSNIKVVDKSSLSGNANASKIILSAGKLVPEFDPNVTSYNVSVDYSVTEVLLSVTSQELNAGISIEGSKTMKVGTNTRTVVITAPNGTVKKYKITIYRAASGEAVTDPEPPVTEPTANPYEITVDGKNLTAASDYTDITVPDGFSPATYLMGDTQIPVLKDIVSGRIIVYAADSEGANGMFALYNEEEKTFSQFKYMVAENFKFIVLDYADAVPTLKNYFYTAVKVGDFSVNGFKYNDTAMTDFVIFYAETGDGARNFYRYDEKEKTVQRAVEFAAEYETAIKPADVENKDLIARFMELELKSKIIVGSGVVAILLIIVLIIIVIAKAVRKTQSAEALAAAKEQEFMDGFGEGNHLFLDDGYDDDDSVLDDDFKFKGYSDK